MDDCNDPQRDAPITYPYIWPRAIRTARQSWAIVCYSEQFPNNKQDIVNWVDSDPKPENMYSLCNSWVYLLDSVDLDVNLSKTERRSFFSQVNILRVRAEVEPSLSQNYPNLPHFKHQTHRRRPGRTFFHAWQFRVRNHDLQEVAIPIGSVHRVKVR